MIPKEGATGWADTLDAVVEVEAPELRVQVDGVGLDPEGAGAAGDLLRRDAGEHEGVRRHGPAQPRARASSTTRTRRPRTSSASSSGRRRQADCGNGKNDCMDYTQVAAGLDGDQGLVSLCEARAGSRRAAPRGRPAAACRRSSGGGRGCGRSRCSCCRSARTRPHLPRRARSAVPLVVLEPGPAQRDDRPLLEPRQLPGALATTTTYWRIACRTIGIAAAVTVTDIVLAFPFAYFMARVAGPRLAGACCSCSCCCRSGRATSRGSTPGG